MQKHSFSDISLSACNHCGTRANMLNWDTTFGSPLFGRTYQAESLSGYRYSFNGKEKDDETYGEGNCIAYEARIYDSRLGRMFSTDPREMEYAWQTPYAYFSNSPIKVIDYLGMGSGDEVKKGEGPKDYADRNGTNLDQLASLNGTVFKGYPKNGSEEEKNNYWKSNKDKEGNVKWMINPGDKLQTSEDKQKTAQANPKTNKHATKPNKAAAPPSYTPPPKNLPGFKGAERVKPKGGRPRWKFPDGSIGEWDGQHGEVERYNPRGGHIGVYNPDGQLVKPPVPGRTIDPFSPSPPPSWKSPSVPYEYWIPVLAGIVLWESSRYWFPARNLVPAP